MEESLLKSNFLGRDGFRWWIGQIPPTESQDSQVNGEGWGNRSKVRIMGYHPYNTVELSNEDLPWAQVLLSTTDGSGAANYGKNHKLKQGDIVFGFFLDGDNAQIPVIVGCFGRTSQVPSTEYAGPFQAFTGYTNRIVNDGSRIKANQTNEQTTEAQKSPYHLPPQDANSINQISYFGGIGDTIQLGTAIPGSKMEKIATEMDNAIKFLQDLKSFPNIAQEWIDAQVENLCAEISKKIEGITTEIVSGVVNNTYEEIIPALNRGAEQVYNTVNSTVFASTQSKSNAHLAGVEAQKAAIEPVKQLQKLIPCLISSIIKSLGSLISDMVCALLKNVANFVSCVIDQFLGGLLNGIIDLITTGMSAVLGVLSLLLSFSNFNLKDSVRKNAEGLSGIPSSLNCGEEPENPESKVQKWEIGSGPVQSSSFRVNDILGLANNARAIADGSESPLSLLESVVGSLDFLNPGISDPDFVGSGLSGCFAGTPSVCNPPSINIFGGGGSGASAIPIFGSIVGDGDNQSGSIIGAILTSGGSGYTYPPFISIKDNCGKGYGAVAQSVIKNGQVSAVLITSDGEGYTVGNQPQISNIVTSEEQLQVLQTLQEQPQFEQSFTISEVLIENPGYNYQSGDIVTDNFGNQYDVVIDGGSISSITPINIKDITDLPVLKVITQTGSGAKLKPVFGFRSSFQGEVKQVIDCVV
jgi:hypothetical protein